MSEKKKLDTEVVKTDEQKDTKDKAAEPEVQAPVKEPGFFGKIGNWIGNEWNAFWNTPTTRAQRCKKAAIILGVAGAAGAVGYGIGYNRGSNSMPDGDDDEDFETTDDNGWDEPIVTEFVDDNDDE